MSERLNVFRLGFQLVLEDRLNQKMGQMNE
jgi:hypothetical protein